MGTKGNLRLDSAYEYAEKMTMTVDVGGRKKEKTFPKTDQFAPELLHFSDCVQSGQEPRPSGREGLADVRVIEALYQSADKGAPVRLRIPAGLAAEPRSGHRAPGGGGTGAGEGDAAVRQGLI